MNLGPATAFPKTKQVNKVLSATGKEELKMKHDNTEHFSVVMQNAYEELWSLVAMNNWLPGASALVPELLYS